MKRLFVGLTLLLMAFFSSLDHLDALHRAVAREVADDDPDRLRREEGEAGHVGT